MSLKKRPVVIGLLGMKCPTCRKGRIFANKSVFPLKDCLKMVDNCEVCGQKMLFESNNGGGINYALTVILFFLNLAWYWPVFGLSYKDNSVYYYLITSTLVVVLVQPWLMRISKVIYLYVYLEFNPGLRPQQDEEPGLPAE